MKKKKKHKGYSALKKMNGVWKLPKPTLADIDAAVKRGKGITNNRTRVQELKKMDYQNYLNTNWWKKTRKLVLVFWDNKCSMCYGEKNLHVHHRTYKRRGEELLSDCVVLCNKCHKLHHGKKL